MTIYKEINKFNYLLIVENQLIILGKEKVIQSTKELVRYFGFWSTLKIIFYYSYKELRYNLSLVPKLKIIKVNGYNLSVIPNDRGISSELLMFRTHEPLTTSLLSNELKEGMVCLDIGSNIGYYVFLESKLVGNKGKVFAVEPSPQSFEVLKNNMKLQDSSNIEVFNFACGNEDGEVDFLTTSRSNWSRVKGLDFKPTLPNVVTKEIKVTLKKLDSFVNEKNLQRLDLIRFDTEGYELKIYEGMRQTLKKFKPLLVFELHRSILGLDGTLQLLNGLKSDGYDIKYYIPKALDNPLIAKTSSVKRFNIDKVIEMTEKNIVPWTFGLFLVNRN